MFAILRTHKHKSISAIARSGRHTFREQITLNARPGVRNPSMGCKDTEAVLSAFRERLPSSRRRDAVVCIEYLITASPEAFQRHGGHLDEMGSGYFRDAIRWLEARHGAKNIISAVVHLDETTPHLVAYVIPFTSEGRLSARHFLGGPRLLRSMQSEFHAACGAARGLQRGIQGSNGKHEEIAKFYASMPSLDENTSLRAIDHAAKAMGFETARWKEATQAAHSSVLNSQFLLKRRARVVSQENALDIRERRLTAKNTAADDRERKIQERERILQRRDDEIAVRAAKLMHLEARAEALERLVDTYENEQKPQPSLDLSRTKSLMYELG